MNLKQREKYKIGNSQGDGYLAIARGKTSVLSSTNKQAGERSLSRFICILRIVECQANITVMVPARENAAVTRAVVRGIYESLRIRDSTRIYESDSRASIAAPIKSGYPSFDPFN